MIGQREGKEMRDQIVLMPGLLCDGSVFTHQIAALGRHADVKVADFSQEDSIEAMARRALGLFEGPVSLVGFSMGGRAALQAVRLAPDRVKRLCLMDTGATPAREGEPAQRQPLIDLAYNEGMGALAARWLPPMLHIDRERDTTLIGPLTEMVLRASPDQHARQIKALLTRPDARPVLAGIRCPVLVMVGRQDRWSTLAQHEEMAAAIPGAELVVIEDAGHFVSVERPEAVTKALMRWFGFEAAAKRDRIPDTPLFDRARQRRGYQLNKMAMGLCDAANRDAFRADAEAYMSRFGLSAEEKAAVMARDWQEMVRLGGNVFYILKLAAIIPATMTQIGAHQAGMDHETFLRDRLGKKPAGSR